MDERTQEEIMASIDHLLDDLDAICRIGFGTYRRYPAEFLVEHDARAAAANTYCHMLAEAERRLSDRPKIVLLDIRGLKVFVIGATEVIRFKRMDEDGISRNYPTKQAKDFDSGETLPGLPSPAARITAGYLPDVTGTSIIRVQIARPFGRSVKWCAAIVPAEDRMEGQSRWIDVTRQVSFGG